HPAPVLPLGKEHGRGTLPNAAPSQGNNMATPHQEERDSQRVTCRADLWAEHRAELRAELRAEPRTERRAELRVELRAEHRAELRVKLRVELWTERRAKLLVVVWTLSGRVECNHRGSTSHGSQSGHPPFCSKWACPRAHQCRDRWATQLAERR